jgi:hypothetical protein
MRHEGTYQVKKLSEPEDAILNTTGSNDSPYLYTLTFTHKRVPSNSRIKLKKQSEPKR